MLEAGALVKHAASYGYDPNTIYVGNCRVIDADSNTLEHHTAEIHDLDDLIDVPNIWRSRPNKRHIVQMETLFPLDLYRSVGGLDEENEYAMDYALWGEMLLAGSSITYTGVDVGVFRVHRDQKTASQWSATKSLVNSAIQLARRHPRWSDLEKAEMIRRLKAYRDEQWRATGRLARFGLPQLFVEAIRDWRDLDTH